MARLNNNVDCIKITFPWNDVNNKAFLGVPPHVELLQEVTQIKDKQALLVADFIEQMKVVLEQMEVDGGRMSEQKICTILDNFEERFISKVGIGNQSAVHPVTSRVEVGRTYQSHYYNVQWFLQTSA
jgi:hypothetical protein